MAQRASAALGADCSSRRQSRLRRDCRRRSIAQENCRLDTGASLDLADRQPAVALCSSEMDARSPGIQIMTIATGGFVLAAVFAAWYVRRYVGFRLSVTFLLFAALILVHGIPLLIYLNITGPDTFVYEAALAPVDRDAIQAKLLWALALMFVFVIMGS